MKEGRFLCNFILSHGHRFFVRSSPSTPVTELKPVMHIFIQKLNSMGIKLPILEISGFSIFYRKIELFKIMSDFSLYKSYPKNKLPWAKNCMIRFL